MALLVRPAAQKGLAGIPKAERDALVDKLNAIANDPYGQHPYAKRLRGTPGFSVRQGGYRAIYRIMGNRDVMVIDAGPRGSIYQP
jgi:mRNA-degrading endonuclease RelE of RelBE toxin-antitoxin system